MSLNSERAARRKGIVGADKSAGRIGNLVIYDFYLKIILGFTVFWYTLLTGFSAQTLFDDGYLVSPLPVNNILNIRKPKSN